MKLVLVDIEEQMCSSWRHAFQKLPGVDIVQGRFEEVANFDCIVSASNSFGIMDGGIDAAIVRFFGTELMEHIQNAVLRDYLGEQLVGTSLIVETGNRQHSFIAHTPTMRVPMPIAHTDNVYRAMWAILLAVRQHNVVSKRKIKTGLCPGLGTGYGQVPFLEAANQMALAYRNYMEPPSAITWGYARRRQEAVRFGGDNGSSTQPAS